MDAITILKGYLMSRLLHGMRIVLLTGTATVFVSHAAVAGNKPDKTLPAEEGETGGFLRTLPAKNVNTVSNTITYTSASEKNYSSYSLSNSPTLATENIPSPAQENLSANSDDDKLEVYTQKLQSYNILQTVQIKTGASNEDMQVFTTYYHDKIYGDDRQAFWKKVDNNSIVTDADIQQYANAKIVEYITLYTNFLQIRKDYPGAIDENSHNNHHTPMALAGCNPACDNIDFETSNLSGWSAYYAVNTSSTTAFSNTAPVGGVCGAVTTSAFDPNTGTNQVTITSGAGVDPIAGALIPVVCPTGGNYSCMIGDGPRNGAQMGILQQSFMVTAANANFIYMYAVVLENPSHIYYEQPYFNVQMLDQNGNPIPNCGNYSVVSGPSLPGFKAIYYAPDADTCYCKPWTTVFVPLQNYIGQCITIKVTTSDCALGGHFGYAYFDAICSVGITPSSPVICNKTITLTGPSGVGSYQWLGPCIIGPSTNQTVTIGCAGTYSVVLASVSNAACADTISITIPPYTPATLTTSGTDVSCNGGNNGTASVTASGGMGSFTYKWLPSGGTNSTASNLTAGTYTVMVKDSVGCPDSATVTITQPTAVTATITSVTGENCNGMSMGTATVLANGGTPGYSYTWSPSGGSNNMASNLTAGTYTVNVTDLHGCSATAKATVTQPTLLVATVTSTTGVSCNGGNNGSATANATGGTGPYNYAWSSGSSIAVANNLTAGTYNVTVTDANGCTATTSTTITEPTALVASVPTTTGVSCNGLSDGSATASATGGTSPYNYSWSSGSSSALANNLSAGNYNVIVTDANGCTNSAVVTITQPAQLTTSISSLTNVGCNGGNNGSATVITSGGTTPYAYAWSSGSTSSTASNLTAGSYNVTITDANGCTTTTSVVVQQPLPITITYTTTEPLCNGMTDGSATASASGGTLPYSYSWSSGSSVAKANNLGAGTYTVIVTDANGCTLTASVIVNQPTVLVAGIGSTTGVSCYGGSNGTAFATATGGTSPYNYAWSVGGSSAAVSNLSAGTYTVNVTDANGCKASTTTTVVQPLPVITTAKAADTICSGSVTTITASATGGNGVYAYQWSAGPGTSSTYNVAPTTTTTYTVMAIDGLGCMGDTAKVTITTLQLTASDINVSPSTAICAGDTTSVYANVNTTNSGNVTINWSNGFKGTGPFIVSPATTTTYTVSVADKCGNLIAKTITITVNPLPVINIPVQTGASCSEVTLFFRDTNANNAGATYQWNFGDGNSSTQPSPAHSYNQSGSYQVSVTVTSTKGCSSSATAPVNITIYPTAKAAFVPTPDQADIINPVITFDNQSENASIWFWDFGDGNTSTERSPSHTYANVGNYKVHLFTNNTYGCADSTDDSVHVVPDFRIFIPNAFSPNGNGVNDYFTAKGIGIVDFNMMVFDRWGTLIFTTQDINKGWNGTVNDGTRVAQEDTYVYKINVTDIFKEQHSYIGAVTLIK